MPASLPALVAVHGVEAANNRGDGGVVVGANLRHLLDEALTRAGVGVAAVHEAMHERLVLQSIGLADLDEFEQVVEAGVDATIRAETHEVELLALFLCISVGSLHLWVLHDGAVLAGAVDLHKVLIDNASGTNVEVTHLRVSHLSVGQTNIFARCLQLRVSRHGREIVEIRGRRVENHVALAMLTDSPSVENHQ